jgi:hypothetical protein
VRVGVIGTGRQGTNVLRGHQRLDDVEIAAICDVYASNLGEGRRRRSGRGQARRLPAHPRRHETRGRTSAGSGITPAA